MVKTNRYNPSNKKFSDHFQKLAKTKTKKGHLNESGERDSEDTLITSGVLTRIEKAKIYANGWEVEVGYGDNKKTYNCKNITGTLAIPDYTESQKYYVMKNQVKVDVSIDNVSKIYSITNIHDINSIFTMKDKEIKISNAPANNNKESSKVVLGEKNLDLKGDNINMNGASTFENKVEIKDNVNIYKNLTIQGNLNAPEITHLQNENKQLKADIEEMREQIKTLLEI